MSANTVINIFVRAVIRSKSITFQIAVDNNQLSSKEALEAFLQMRANAQSKTELSLEEINAEINEVLF